MDISEGFQGILGEFRRAAGFIRGAAGASGRAPVGFKGVTEGFRDFQETFRGVLEIL